MNFKDRLLVTLIPTNHIEKLIWTFDAFKSIRGYCMVAPDIFSFSLREINFSDLWLIVIHDIHNYIMFPNVGLFIKLHLLFAYII